MSDERNSNAAHYWLGRAVGLLSRMQEQQQAVVFYNAEIDEIISAVSGLHQASREAEVMGPGDMGPVETIGSWAVDQTRKGWIDL